MVYVKLLYRFIIWTVMTAVISGCSFGSLNTAFANENYRVLFRQTPTYPSLFDLGRSVLPRIGFFHPFYVQRDEPYIFDRHMSYHNIFFRGCILSKRLLLMKTLR